MAAPQIRFTRQHGRDLCTAAGVVVVTYLVLSALPEIDSDLPPGLVLMLVCAGAALFLFKRIVLPLSMKWIQYRVQRSRARRSRRRSSTLASGKDT
jgi:hypothetical protein